MGTVVLNYRAAVDFYCGDLGMRVDYGPFTAFDERMPVAFGQRQAGSIAPFGVDNAAFLRYSTDDEEGVVDLGWWQRPRSEGNPYSRPNHVGHQRTGIRVPSAMDAYRELADRGVATMGRPVEIDLDGPIVSFCLRNPEGVGVQILELPDGSARDRRIQLMSTTVYDMAESLSFYCDLLGMTIVRGPFEVSGPAVGQLYGLSAHKSAALTGVWLRPGNYVDGTLVELLEWHKPASYGEPYPRYLESGGSFANHVGIVRVAFNVHGYQRVYEELVEAGVQFVSPPVVSDIGPEVAYCCFENPDGTMLQLYEYVRGAEADFQRS